MATKYKSIKHPVYGHIPEHRAIAQDVLGKVLPKGAIVHHHNKNGLDNRNCNLVICQNESYHKLIHRRMRKLNNTKIIKRKSIEGKRKSGKLPDKMMYSYKKNLDKERLALIAMEERIKVWKSFEALARREGKRLSKVKAKLKDVK